MTAPIDRVRQLSCWDGPVDPQPLSGGITNANFLVESGGCRYFVRAGDDIPVHGILRFHELATSLAAQAAGLSPAVVHHEPGVLVLDFIDGKTLAEEDVRESRNLTRIVPLIRRFHRDVQKQFRGPALIFWVFHVVRDYAATLRAGHSRMVKRLPEWIAVAEQLERAVGPVELVFGHNDLLSANFMDDGDRLWLIDFDYAGFNSPLFDLGGLSSNNGLSEAQEIWLLETYFGRKVDETLWKAYTAMKCASLLRESLWSMVSELHSTLDFDYSAYTEENLVRFESALKAFQDLSA